MWITLDITSKPDRRYREVEMELLTERYSDRIVGVHSCYDRIIIQGTLPHVCYAEGMTAFLYQKKIRVFDFKKDFAQPLRDALIENAKGIAEANNVAIEYLNRKHIRKEDRIREILKQRGEHPGLVHIFSALESCTSYKPWHDKQTHKTFLKYGSGMCLHYYFYFIDEVFGLMYVRVPTWVPFRLQVYLNGHAWLASKLRRKGIECRLMDNAMVSVGDWDRAQQLSDDVAVKQLHRALDRFAVKYCPVMKVFREPYHWSIMQAEYATDIIFKRKEDLQAIYETIIRTAIHTVKPEHVATFLGRKLNGNYQDEVGNDFNTRIEGTRLRHSMGKASIKLYDKFGLILRIETVVNDVSFFKHYREVVHRNGTTEKKYAQMRKGIYNLNPLRELLCAANRRYLEFISTLEDNSTGARKMERITQTVKENGHTYKGFNFFNHDDLQLLRVIMSGEHNVSGFQNKNLRMKITDKTSAQISRTLKRLRTHGMIKKIGKTYKYYLTSFGKEAICLALKLRELYIIPQLQSQT